MGHERDYTGAALFSSLAVPLGLMAHLGEYPLWG